MSEEPRVLLEWRSNSGVKRRLTEGGFVEGKTISGWTHLLTYRIPEQMDEAIAELVDRVAELEAALAEAQKSPRRE